MEDAEHGFCTMASPWDPAPGLILEGGCVAAKDDPIQMATDAATAALHGFRDLFRRCF